MRLTRAAIALTILSATVVPAAAGETRNERIVRVYTERGRKAIEVASETERPAASLRLLERATRYLERVRRLDAAAARSELVEALNGLTRIHLERRSLPRALKFNKRALAIDASNGAARRLARAIAADGEIDLNDRFDGTTALRRLAERRASMGIPYRPRGYAIRR